MGYTKFNVSAAGNNVIVAGQADKKIQVTAIFFTVNILTTVTIRSGTSSSGDFTGPMQFQAGTGLNLPFVGFTLFECGVGESLVLNLSGLLTQGCAGALIYDYAGV